MILITRIGSLIYSVPEGYAHDKCKQGVSVPYYALVHFYHQSWREGLIAFVKHDYLELFYCY